MKQGIYSEDVARSPIVYSSVEQQQISEAYYKDPLAKHQMKSCGQLLESAK